MVEPSSLLLFVEILSQGSMLYKQERGGWGMRRSCNHSRTASRSVDFPHILGNPNCKGKTHRKGSQASLTSWLRLTRILFLFKNCKFEWYTCNILFQTNHLLKYHMVFGFHLRLVLGCVNVAPGFPPARCAGETQAGKEKNSWNQAANPALQKHADHWHQNW